MCSVVFLWPSFVNREVLFYVLKEARQRIDQKLQISKLKTVIQLDIFVC